MTSSIQDIKVIEIPKIVDFRGNISVVEKTTIPFSIKRVYYIYDIPSTSVRGGHAHKQQSELLIAVSGSFVLQLHDGFQEKTIFLNRPNQGVLLPHGIWRELKEFSSGAVCLVLSSGEFDESDYIRDFDTFSELKKDLKK